MSEFTERLDQLKTSLFEREEVRQYFALKAAIESDPILMEANANMRFHQKEMAKHMGNLEIYTKEKALFEHFSSVYQNHPLVVNYEQAKNAVHDLLRQLKDILEK